MIDHETEVARWMAQSRAESRIWLMGIHKVEKPDCMVFDAGVLGLLVYVRKGKLRRHEPHWVVPSDVVQIAEEEA